MKTHIEEDMDIPDGIQVSIDKDVTVKGPKGTVKRPLFYPGVEIKVAGKKVTLTCKKATKREKKMLYTYMAHIANMFKGVQTPWVYKLKVCTGHFPMTVNLAGNALLVKNFLGEKIPRKMIIKQGVTVKVDGKDITVESIDKELAGAVASDMELLTAISKKDRRVFQDGIYMIEKAGKLIK
jgi:large subunit ribosomal protein L6